MAPAPHQTRCLMMLMMMKIVNCSLDRSLCGTAEIEHLPIRSAAGKPIRSPGNSPVCGKHGATHGVRQAAVPQCGSGIIPSWYCNVLPVFITVLLNTPHSRCFPGSYATRHHGRNIFSEVLCNMHYIPQAFLSLALLVQLFLQCIATCPS